MYFDMNKVDSLKRFGCLGALAINVLVWCVLVWVIVTLCGCSQTRYVPVESVRTEYKDREVERIIADTITSTRFVWVKGDTIVDIREKERIHRIEIHDTCFIERHDSIAVPYPVERKLTWWQQTKMDLGGIAIGALAFAICSAVFWLILKFRK